MGDFVLELAAKLKLDKKEYENGLKDSKEDANNFASNLKEGLMKVGKLTAEAFVVATGAVSAFATQAIKSFGEYEQLLGGVQKLYGNAGMSLEEYAETNGKTVDEISEEWQRLEDAQNQVLKNAENAYLTSGMSMNEYMETATTFSASLIKSLGGDTMEAARITDIAMQAISDNVNTFGSDMESVSNAFKGLSRQNYMMIDNLKLGYSGTAQGMLELINDSGVLGKTLKSTSELATVGFDQMILAIQAVQKQQGIAGTTAREALHTIEGSANATKKAWQNVITSIGRGEGLAEALNNLQTAVLGDGTEKSGFLAQIIPRIQTTMESIADFIVMSGPIISERLPELASSILPSVFEAAVSLIENLASSLPELFAVIFPVLYDIGLDVVSTIVDYLMENLPMILETGVNMINSLADGIRENLPAIISAITTVLAGFLGEIIYELPDIIAAGINIIFALIDGIIDSIPDVLDAVGDIIDAAWNAFIKFDWISLGKNIIDGIVSGINRFGGAIANTLSNMAHNAWASVKSFFGISSPSKLMRDTIGRYIPEGLAEGIEDGADSVYDAMDDLANMTVSAYDPVFDDIFTERIERSGSSGSNSLIDEVKSLKQAILGMNIVLDTGATVGGLAYAMDSELGTIHTYKGRGN